MQARTMLRNIPPSLSGQLSAYLAGVDKVRPATGTSIKVTMLPGTTQMLTQVGTRGKKHHHHQHRKEYRTKTKDRASSTKAGVIKACPKYSLSLCRIFVGGGVFFIKGGRKKDVNIRKKQTQRQGHADHLFRLGSCVETRVLASRAVRASSLWCPASCTRSCCVQLT